MKIKDYIRSARKPLAEDSAQLSYPLSYAQERFWLLDQLHPGNPAYNISQAFRIKGHLCRDSLDKSVHFLLNRHESLRTTFLAPIGIPRQEINEPNQFKIEYIDLRGTPEEALDAAVDEVIQRQSQHSFQLDQKYLIRVLVIQARTDESILLIVQHHIISDGTSLSLLTEELGNCYSAFVTNRTPELPNLPLTYPEYSIQQRQKLETEDQQKMLAYWVSNLKKCPVLNLPTDRTRPKIQTFNGTQYKQKYDQDRTLQLRNLATESNGTIFMLLLTAFKVLLGKLSGQNDIVVGTPIAGRNHLNIQNMQGLFLNTLALRTRFCESSSFKALLEEVRDVALQAYSSMDIPFEKIIEAIQPERDPSRPPFFQVLINLFPRGENNLKMHDLKVERLDKIRDYAKFDITLYISMVPDGLDLTWAYNRDLFDKVRIEQMAAQYSYLLDQVLLNPEQRIDHLSLVTPAARDLLPDPTLPIASPEHPPIATVVERWASLTPDAPAVSQDGETWNYEKLLAQSRGIAQTLLSKHVDKGEVVAITGDASNLLVAGMLGILLAGGVLLTIDPEAPPNYKKRMLESTHAKYLLSVNTPIAEMSWGDNVQVLEVSKEVNPEGVLETPDVLADDPAYIFFTSGTTGAPKPILGTHKGLSHFLHWEQETFDIIAADRFAQTTKLSFDVLLRDVFLPLISGGTLVISDSEKFRFHFLDWLREKRITRFHTVPSVLKFWLGEHKGDANNWSALKTIFAAGEPLEAGLVERLREVMGPTVEVVNLYGPTETTLAKSSYLVPDPPTAGIQPIGKPLPQTQILIVNKHNQLCGIFEPGEIVIRTPFATRGYLTGSNEAFLPNPFTQDEGDIVYRTGDIGWYLPDGNAAIGGRKDDQIKIRGVRIEPAAVSSALAGYMEIKNNCVLPFRDPDGELYLAAYVVPSSSTVTGEQIRQYLQEQLPAAYIPSAIVSVEEIPLTPNGKVDRSALPDPAITPAETDDVSLPENPIEEQLVVIWTEVLQTNSVGMLDTFFDMGGHSLRAVRILNRIRDDFQIELPLGFFFKNPTIREMATEISSLQKNRN